MCKGPLSDWQSYDQTELSALMPTNRRYAFDTRKILHHLFDIDSFIETRPDMGRAIVTGFARIEGRAVAVLGERLPSFGWRD